MKKGITSNVLKLIAVILVLIDHSGMYLYKNMTEETYDILRGIGRMAMPVFLYLLIQGFFYTKNIKKYILRLFVLATVTQIILVILGYINATYHPEYWTSVNNYLGVLYSYTLSLVILTAIDRKVVLDSIDENKNIIIRINMIVIAILVYLKIKIEFDMRIPFMAVELYAIEKLFCKNGELISKQKDVSIIRKMLYLISIFIVLALSLIYVNYSSGNKYMVLASIVLIALYNGEKGKDSQIIKYLFYLFFPIQHAIFYLLGMGVI